VPLDRRGQWYRYHHLFRDMLLAELERLEPGLMSALRRRAADWCLRNDLPEEALEYSMAAGDVEAAARLVEKLGLQTHRQARFTTLQRWFGWLEDHGAFEGHPMIPIMASLLSALTARPNEAVRWADVVDRWQYGDSPRAADPYAEAHAAQLRAILCRHGVEKMRADAEEALRKCAEQNIVAPAPALFRGIAQVLCGDREGGDASFEAAISAGQAVNAAEALAIARCERALLAMARGEWDQAEGLADQARAELHRAGIEESFSTPLVCAVQARTALHRGDGLAMRQQLVAARRLRPLLTYAHPALATQVRIELTRIHLALADLAGARALMQEIDELLRQRPGLGTLVGEAGALRDRLANGHGSSTPNASALTAAELRLLPLLSTHLSFPEIAAELSLSPNTIKSQALSIYRKLDATSRNQAVAQARMLGLLEG
jgi:LuxR family maltose regulon positive regulatory protein